MRILTDKSTSTLEASFMGEQSPSPKEEVRTIGFEKGVTGIFLFISETFLSKEETFLSKDGEIRDKGQGPNSDINQPAIEFTFWSQAQWLPQYF